MIYDEDGVRLYHGDAIDVLASLPAESVDCVVTSPPYWSLRKYDGEQVRVWGGDPECAHRWERTEKEGATLEGYAGTKRSVNGRNEAHPEARSRRENADDWARISRSSDLCADCGAWRGAYGLEPRPEQYVENTITVLRAIRRVLKPTGVCWWNVADSYAGSLCGAGDTKTTNKGNPHSRHQAQGRTSQRAGRTNAEAQRMERTAPGLKPKDLVLIPFRVALAAQADGWWVRSDVIWAKPNPMPESVTDRPTKAHEYVFLLTKSERYAWDQDAVREPLIKGAAGSTFTEGKTAVNGLGRVSLAEREDNACGRNIRSVWTIPTQPSPLPHFAAFPDELAERCIKAGCPSDGTVLDPFSGTGTTLKVARQLGRQAIGIEISRDYCELAVQRLRYGTRGTLAVRQGQGTLWEGA